MTKTIKPSQATTSFRYNSLADWFYTVLGLIIMGIIGLVVYFFFAVVFEMGNLEDTTPEELTEVVVKSIPADERIARETRNLYFWIIDEAIDRAYEKIDKEPLIENYHELSGGIKVKTINKTELQNHLSTEHWLVIDKFNPVSPVHKGERYVHIYPPMQSDDSSLMHILCFENEASISFVFDPTLLLTYRIDRYNVEINSERTFKSLLYLEGPVSYISTTFSVLPINVITYIGGNINLLNDEHSNKILETLVQWETENEWEVMRYILTKLLNPELAHAIDMETHYNFSKENYFLQGYVHIKGLSDVLKPYQEICGLRYLN